MSKRAAAIFNKPLEGNKGPEPSAEGKKDVPMTGNWSRMAYENMEKSLKGHTKELSALKSSYYAGVMSGEIPVHIAAENISDEMGSDRVASAENEEDDPGSFAALLDNIKRRGLRTPIRVRPANPDWRPDPENPQDVTGQRFLLQSGRRRLAACIELGIEPIAFISFPEVEKIDIEDLQERFFENVSRQDLTTGEKLFSIGLLSESMPDLQQSQIAEILHVPRSHVVKGIRLYKDFDRVKALIDLSTASFRQIENAFNTLDRGADDAEKTEQSTTASRAPLPFNSRTIAGRKVSLSRNSKGACLMKIQMSELDEETIARVLTALETAEKQC